MKWFRYQNVSLPLHPLGSSLLSLQSGIPLQYFDNGMHVPFGHFHSDILHICFDFVIGMLLLFALLPTLLLFARLLLVLLDDFSECCCFCFSCWCSCGDGDGDCSSCFCWWFSTIGDAGDNGSSNDDDGNDKECTSIGFDTNVSKPISAHSSADTKQCPSIWNYKLRKKQKTKFNLIWLHT